MFPANFDYTRAGSIDEALALLGRGDGAKLLAGGHSLLPMMKLRLAQPSGLIDIGRIPELAGISRGDNHVRIGAATTHATLASSKVLAEDCPLLAEAAAKIADPAVRNKGTLGGNIAHADPASDLPAVLVALGARIHLRSAAGSREVAARDFFLDLFTTALGEAEILTAVDVPKLPFGTGSCYAKVEQPASGFALCGAAAWVRLDGDGRTVGAALAYNGIAPTPVVVEVGAALSARVPDDAAIERAVTDHLSVAEPLSDLHASAEYRLHLARVYGRRALEKARDRARS
ncbi:MAG TPA: xanthine dehydrogenase family protein subunit M [Thermoanaerobaculia bacterium]|nr:xanthine dehydrogenase family protein subunit M [Thermoanaerobaculia bacterium]